MDLTSIPIVGAYLVVVVSVKKFSQHTAVEIPNVLVAYNAIATLWAVFTTCAFVISFLNNDHKVLLLALRLYWLSKIYELLDTIFMLVRRKFNQVSTLHLYHHASMAVMMEWFYRAHPVMGLWVPGFLNSFVHIVMYSYYTLTALGRSPWWKKYLTQLQLTQFGLLICHGIYGGLFTDDHVYWFYVAYEISMMVCFLQFYDRAYKKNDKKA